MKRLTLAQLKRNRERYLLWREANLYRAAMCEACYSEREPLHLHHIRHRLKSNWADPENLITLCATCHREIHDKGKKAFCDKFPFLKVRLGIEK